MSSRGKNIVTGALVITLILGTLNSIYKNSKLPGLRFYFGSGILYLFLIGMGEFEEELSKSLAVAIMVFVVLGEGGGVLDHFLGGGASKSTLDTTPKNDNQSRTPDVHRRDTGRNATAGTVHTAAVKPAIPFS